MTHTRIRIRSLVITCMVAVAAVGTAPSAGAQPARAVGPTPPRIAFIDGEVSFWRPGAGDWAPAQVNTALAAGDHVYAGERGNVEIEVGSRAYVRGASGTEIAVASLETGYLQLEVTSGSAALDLDRLAEGQEIELDTPKGAFIIDRDGYYRVDVDDDRTTFTTRRGGVATVIPGGGEETDVGESQQVVLEGDATITVEANPAPAVDAWDRWNYDRTGRRPERPRGAEYVPPTVAGVDELDAYGDWSETPDYGHVWVPRDVPDDWAPYSTGDWVWDPYYGWTWVDEAPWGWAPYHYGRWCRVHDAWAWAPGPVVATPVYAPALVAFFGPHAEVSVSVGAPFVSWVALGFGEPVIPWWGPAGFVGRPYWAGWGGRHIVNNTVVNNTTIVNVTNIHEFRNVHVRNAVLGIDRERFGRGRVKPVRLAPAQLTQLPLVRGRLGVKPVPTSLVPRTGRAPRPPEQVRNRRVVATRRPQDPVRRLRDAGIEPRGTAKTVEPRIVEPRRGRDRGRRERAGESGGGAPPPGRERGIGTERPGAAGAAPEINERGRRGRGSQPGEKERNVAPPGAAGPRGNVRERGRGNERQQRVEPPAPPESGNVRERRGGGERGGPTGPAKNDRGIQREPRGRNSRPEQGVAPAPPGVDRRGVEPDRDRSRREKVAPAPPQGENRPEQVAPPAPPRDRNRREQAAPPAPPQDRGRRERVAPPAPSEGARDLRSRGQSNERRERTAPLPDVRERVNAPERGRGNDRRERAMPPAMPDAGERGNVRDRGTRRERDVQPPAAVQPPRHGGGPAQPAAPESMHPRERHMERAPSGPKINQRAAREAPVPAARGAERPAAPGRNEQRGRRGAREF